MARGGNMDALPGRGVQTDAMLAGPNASLEHDAKVGPGDGDSVYVKAAFQAKVRNRGLLYGPAEAIHLQMDRAILSCHQRHGCLPSARPHLRAPWTL